MRPLQGRDLGIARGRLRETIHRDADPPAAVEKIEAALAWFVNGDGVCYPSLAALRERVAADNGGVGLHRSTITKHVPRLRHFVTIGYFARNESGVRSGALRGVAIRVVEPELARRLGFPPLPDALERLAMYRWLLPTADFVTHFEASSENGRKTQ